jgi:hypothetical protein
MPKYTVKGIGDVDLTQRDFIAKGGEGTVYGKGNVAYKIYEDPANMLPTGKIQELSVLDHPNIIKPDRILLNSKNVPVGYTMRLVNGTALCQLFTKAFKQRNNIDNGQIINLVKEIHNLVDFTHKKGILIVDLNELNYLVDGKFKEIYAIDVNSYQTPSFPATVIMPSIRDRHCKNHFSKETDWFSWGIVTFQMMIGIHPYKGTHPDFDKLSPDDRLDARMTKNISVFNPQASIPKVCNPFDVIPAGLRAWYKTVFEDGKRCAPPSDFVGGVIVIAPTLKQIAGSNLFEIKEVETYPSEILAFYSCDGNQLVLTDKTAHLNRRTYSVPSNNAKFAFTPKMGHPVSVYLDNGHLQIFDVLNQKQIPFLMAANAVMECAGRIYVQSGMNVLELNFIEIGNSLQVSTKHVGSVLDVPGATKVYDGVIIQSLLGRYFASLFPSSGRCHQVGIPELDQHTVMDAKYEKNVLVIVAAHRKTGKYDRLVLRLADDFASYDLRKVENITPTGINFTVNDAGVCTLMNEEEKLEAFSKKMNASTVKVLDDPALESDMRLYHDGARIVFTKENKLYSISTRKP